MLKRTLEKADLKSVEPARKRSKAESIEVIESTEVFADPTYDVTFKMLFGSEPNKEILISLLNSLLGFVGDKEIIDVEINSNELPVSHFSKIIGESGIESSVDVICTNKGKQKIAIEMQGQKTKYFLAREQQYMARMISGQVKEGQGALYHEKVLDTYIIVIGKANIFVGNTQLSDQKLFEIDVCPMVLQTHEVVPGNKMYWKFFELPKFAQSDVYKSITKDSEMKYQWLEFLLDCSKQSEDPDRNEIIKKGYEIMKIANWNEDQKILYWKQKATEQAFLETQKSMVQESYEKGKIEAEIVSDIEKVLVAFEFELPLDKIVSKLKQIKDNVLTALIDYIKSGHAEDKPEDIGAALELFGDRDAIDSEETSVGLSGSSIEE